MVFACDYSEDAIAAHRANHPETEHLQAELPLPRRRLPFPKDGRKFHVHGSPPCTLFSTMNSRQGGESEARHAATKLVSWYLKTALNSGCTSWTMEQVPSKVVLRVVERFRLKHRARMDYGVFDFYDLGVPQRRKRLLAGTPALIARREVYCAPPWNEHSDLGWGLFDVFCVAPGIDPAWNATRAL